MSQIVCVPDAELVEVVHIAVGPRQMACGASSGVGVNEWGAQRVTCEGCRAWLTPAPTTFLDELRLCKGGIPRRDRQAI